MKLQEIADYIDSNGWADAATAFAAMSAEATTVDTVVDAILVDTGTTIPGTISTAQADLDTITGSDGVTLATSQGNYAPAVAGDSMDMSSISGDATAADNLETMLDGTGGGTLSLGQLAISNSGSGANISLEGSGAGNGIDFIRSGSGDPLDTNIMSQLNAEMDTAISDASLSTAAALATVDTEVGQIKTVTDALPDAGALTTIDTNVNAILADTGTDGVVVTGTPDVNVTQISGSATAADNLEASTLGIHSTTVATGTSTTVFTLTAGETRNDAYNGRVVVFTSGNVAGEAVDITDYVGASKQVTVSAALTGTPSGNNLVIV